MKSRISLVFVGGLSLIALASACGGAAVTDVATPPATDTDGGSSGTSGAMSSGGTSGTSGSSGDGGADTDAAPATSPFASAPAYTPTTGRNTLQPGDHPGNGDPSKLACFDCHGGSGPGPTFFAAGSVFKDAAGTMPAAQVEVRLLADSGKAVSTYTDTLGNFVVTTKAASTAGVAFPIHAGARNGTTTQLMSAGPANGDCNNTKCHGGSQGWIHVP